MNKIVNISETVDHTDNIIEIEDVCFSYDNKENVLDKVTLQIHKGDYIGLVGPNGSGKTTLIKIILGLIKPDSGSVKIFKKDINNFDNWEQIGYVSQRIGDFDRNFPITVFEVVKMGLYNKKNIWNTNVREEKERVEKALNEVGMSSSGDRLIGNLSGGQMQRVFIARTLVNNPKIIFLDEPTTGIDEKSQNEFYQLLQKLNKEMHITLVIVSHDIARLTKEVMHIVCVDKTLTCHTTPEEFIKESQSSNIFGQDVKIITHHNHK